MASQRASPRIKAKAKEVEDLQAQVRAALAKEEALGYPVEAFPPVHIPSKSLVPRYGAAVDESGMMPMPMNVHPQEWFERQRAIIKAELKKEIDELRKSMRTHYQLKQQQAMIEDERMRVNGLEEIQRRKEIRLREEMEYNAKVGKKEDILIVTTASVPGYRIKEVCNTVMGFGLIDIDEEEDTEEELLLSPHLARVHAVEQMVADALRMHANAIISFRWSIQPLNAQSTKVLAQGTAVMLEKDGPVHCGECGTVKKKQKGDGGGGGGGNNQKGNNQYSHDHSHSHDHSTSSGGASTANTQKQKQQQQQKAKGGGGANKGAGGTGNGKNAEALQQQQGKKNKGKQNQQNDSSFTKADSGTADDDANEETRSDDDNDDQSDADDDDNVTTHSNNNKNKNQNQQKGKGQNQHNQGGGGGGKGGKGQKLTAAQQIIKLLAESKIREDRQKSEETEKERLYKHMEEFFKQRDGKTAWGHPPKKEMTTMDWLKNIEKEIEERNKKKEGASTTSGKGKNAWGSTSNSKPEPTGWGEPDDKPSSSSAAEPVGWGDESGSAAKPDNSDKKGKQKGKEKQDNSKNAAASTAWNTGGSDKSSKKQSPAQTGAQATAGWGTPVVGPSEPQQGGASNAWGENAAGQAGGQGDPWGESAPVNIPSGPAQGGWN